MANKDRIRIEQALFGYQDGHNLVASSIPFEPQVRQFLSNVTDGSGSEKADGFENAYTGLPVAGTSYYALFCTWSAPEMPRPGCVWSQVLLVNFADLARIEDLSVLRKYFSRPKLEIKFENYKEAIFLESAETIASFENHGFDGERAASLLEAIYGKPDSSIVVLDEKNAPWETVVFSIWSQQWPRLRRNFAFSTGSLGDRRSSGVNFDLQIAPQGSQRLWRRNDMATTVVQAWEVRPSLNKPGEIEAILFDLQHPAQSSLRKFFHKYGSEIDTPRAAFLKLVQLFSEPIQEEDDDSGGRLVQVAQAFPLAEEAISLKRDQLSLFLEESSLKNADAALTTAHFLLLAKEANAFEKVEFDFSKFVKVFWGTRRAETLALLGEINESNRSKEFVKAAVDILRPEDVPHLWREQESVLSKVIHERPELATDAGAWAMPEEGQRALWDALKEASPEEEVWAQICSAMLLAQCAIRGDETVVLAGSKLSEGLMKWLSNKSFRLPLLSWRRALERPLQNMLAEKDLHSSILALAAWVLWRSNIELQDGHDRHIQRMAKEGLQEIPKALELPTVFWLTALGLRTRGRDGLNLVLLGFFPTYEAVAISSYFGDDWDRLAGALPKPKFGQAWDRCKLMRRGLKHWLRENPDMARDFQKLAPTGYSQLVNSVLEK